MLTNTDITEHNGHKVYTWDEDCGDCYKTCTEVTTPEGQRIHLHVSPYVYGETRNDLIRAIIDAGFPVPSFGNFFPEDLPAIRAYGEETRKLNNYANKG